jgi:hypothetical protein
LWRPHLNLILSKWRHLAGIHSQKRHLARAFTLGHHGKRSTLLMPPRRCTCTLPTCMSTLSNPFTRFKRQPLPRQGFVYSIDADIHYQRLSKTIYYQFHYQFDCNTALLKNNPPAMCRGVECCFVGGS